MLLLFLLDKTEELLHFAHLEIVKSNCPHEPIKLFSQLQALSGDNHAVKASRLHARESPGHLELLLNPVSVSQDEDFDHQLDVTVHLHLLQMAFDFNLLFVFKLPRITGRHYI